MPTNNNLFLWRNYSQNCTNPTTKNQLQTQVRTGLLEELLTKVHKIRKRKQKNKTKQKTLLGSLSRLVPKTELVFLTRSLDLHQCPGRFLGIVGQDPSVSKSNRLHVEVFRFSLLL